MTNPYVPQQPEPHGGHPQPAPEPDNNLIWGIVTTIFCCPALGLVAIWRAIQVRTLWAMGASGPAYQSADDAKRWAKWSAGLGAIGIALLIAFYIIFFVIIISSASSGG